jgi:hypothetical protein
MPWSLLLPPLAQPSSSGGGKRSQVEDYPFRAAFTVKNEERRNNLLEGLARSYGTVRFIPDQLWAITWPEILTDPLGGFLSSRR